MNFDRWRHAARAWLFHFIGKDARACEEYALAHRLSPSAHCARSLGCLHAQAGAMTAAIPWFEEAVRLEPAHAETWFNLGFARERDGRHGEAIAAFRESVRLKPTIDRAWFGMGMAHAARRDFDAAIEAFEEAARLQPMNPEARYQLGLSCFQSGDRQRTRAAIAELKQFDPKRANALIHDTDAAAFADLLAELPF